MAATTLGAIQTATTLLVGNKELSIDNWTFKLFYQWSVSMLVGFSVLISCNQFFGEPIHCDLPNAQVSEKVLKAYCWMYSSFKVPSAFLGNCARRSHDDGSMHNSYYQWVSIFLIFQAILFYVPRMIWLFVEGGLMKFLGKGTTGKIIEDSDEKVDSLLKTFRANMENKYSRYATWFFLCETLNVVVVVIQFLITNVLLKYQFMFYGPLVYAFYNMPAEEAVFSNFINPMCEVFPRVASCTYYKYSSGGFIEGYQALCILSLNIVIDKVFLILWFWYVILFWIGLLRIVGRCFQLNSKMRYFLIRMKMHRYFKKSENLDVVRRYILSCSVGDWFVLYQMSKNLNKKFFYDFLIKLSKEVQNMNHIQ